MNLENIILSLISASDEELTSDFLKKEKAKFSRENKLKNIPTNMQILSCYQNMISEWKIEKRDKLKNILKKRSVRSESWIIPVQVLTKPWPCPWKCIFCPDDATMPKSYINTEPWAMRALLNQFDPIKQVYNRLLSLSMTWHDLDKIEMIVLWWTWDSYPDEYKIWFIKSLFDACNTFNIFKSKINIDWNNPKFSKFTITKDLNIKYSKSINEAQKINENSDCRIIWLTIETRPEFVTDYNCRLWRKLWVTRIEMWIQSLFDDVLIANDRWHTVQQTRDALHKLRQYWFKFSCHIMPWLYKSTIEKDIETFRLTYKDDYIKPDEIKFYPTSVIPNTRLFDYYKSWDYKPLNTEEIEKIILETHLNIIPPYTRVKRLIRDIPETEIVAWSKVTNLRQLSMNKLQKDFDNSEDLRVNHYKKMYPNLSIISSLDEIDFNSEIISNNIWLIKTYVFWDNLDLSSRRNFVSFCTRSREIRNKNVDTLKKDDSALIVIRQYDSSVWKEYFISFEDNKWYLYWFTRLLIPSEWQTVSYLWLWKGRWLIRELHVYWKLVSLNWKIPAKFQHQWFWTNLMEIAEIISKKSSCSWLSVISWIWVRWYYKKLWYKLIWTYMVKDFN